LLPTWIFLAVIGVLILVVILILLQRRSLLGSAKAPHVDIDLYLLVDKETGLYNQRFFTKRIQEEIHRYNRYHSPFSLGLLKLPPTVASMDDASLGKFLRQVGAVIEKDTRLTDVVSRFGREDIGVLFSMTGQRGAEVPVYRIKEKINQLLQEEGIEGEARFVVYGYPEDARKIDEFVEKLRL
jgi:diguanylate cyclase (GGDEF)-like protein